MLQDVLTDLARAPLWAQIALSLFALIFVYSVVGSYIESWRYRSRFAALAREFGQSVVSSDGRVRFSAVVGDRRFEVRHEYRATSGKSTDNYRGPRGHLLVSATRLAHARWELHQVDIRCRETGLLRLIQATVPTTGDPVFDARFLIREDGIPVRQGWLDAPTRAAVQGLFDGPAVEGLVWIHEQEVMHLVRSPWKGITGPTMRSLLERQAALASSLERTAGIGGP